ncbi:MAG: hypothetical protein ACRBK7_09880 [Acidimicrobiales bacterium]
MTLFSRTTINDQSEAESFDAVSARRQSNLDSSHDSATAKKAAGKTSATDKAASDSPATAVHLQMLGLSPGATWDEITEAHARLVSDLTPGPNASHRNVSLAEQFLSEVNQAFASLRMQSVA